MRIFVAGATGVIGEPLVSRLIREGHEVTGMTRSAGRGERLRKLGGTPCLCDALDGDGVRRALHESKPEIVIHQLTRIPARLNPRRIGRELAATNRLRDEGTRILWMAAREVGARRMIVQSVAFAYRPGGAGPRTEEDPLYDDAPGGGREIVGALLACERQALAADGPEGIVLRYGYFYGPGTIYARDGTFAADVRRRRVPIVGTGAGFFSFIHVSDAADATVAAMARGRPGIYNIVDDQPVAWREWVTEYASLLGAARPMRVPRFVGRLAAGPYGLYMMEEQSGASNRKAKQELDWRPRRPTWRAGFAEMLGDRGPASGRSGL